MGGMLTVNEVGNVKTRLIPECTRSQSAKSSAPSCFRCVSAVSDFHTSLNAEPPGEQMDFERLLGSLLSADREPVDANRGRGHAATEFQVAAYLGDIAEHFLQVAGYGDFFYRIGQLAVDDPHAGGS